MRWYCFRACLRYVRRKQRLRVPQVPPQHLRGCQQRRLLLWVLLLLTAAEGPEVPPGASQLHQVHHSWHRHRLT